MRWEFRSAAGSFRELSPAWDTLNRSLNDHVLLTSRFVGPLLKYFGNRHVLMGIRSDSTRPAMLLLVQRSMLRWETFQPSQAPLGLVNFGFHDDTGELLREMLYSLPLPALQLAILQQDPDFSPFPNRIRGVGIKSYDYIGIPRLEIQGSFEDYWKRRSVNLRHNLSRQRRRLRERGRSLELVARLTPEEVGPALKEFCRLEAQGWKGRAGTAVTENGPQGRFYREVLESFCAMGEGIIFQHLLDGRVIASELCLRRHGTMIVLKTAYDESLRGFSPALLMQQQIIQQLFETKVVRVVEYYGRAAPWHAKWTRLVRRMYHLNCYRYPWAEKLHSVMSAGLNSSTAAARYLLGWKAFDSVSQGS